MAASAGRAAAGAGATCGRGASTGTVLTGSGGATDGRRGNLRLRERRGQEEERGEGGAEARGVRARGGVAVWIHGCVS